MTFNPNEHMRKLSRKQKNKDGSYTNVSNDYLDVKWRLVWLREDHPAAHIFTELVEHDPQAKFAMFKASVSIPDGGSATGYGSETSADFGDYIEKAETKAIGRALGALGYGTQFGQEFDMDNADGSPHVVDSPVEPRQQAAQPQRQHGPGTVRDLEAKAQQQAAPANGDRLTDPQRKAIFAIGKSKGYTAMELDEIAATDYGAIVNALTKKQASEMIDALQKVPAEGGN